MRRLWLLLLLLPCLWAQAQRSPLVIAPYLQVGPRPSPTTMEVWWGAAPGEYEVRYQAGGAWRSARPTSLQVDSCRLYRATLSDLTGPFQYQVLQGKNLLFQARAQPLKARGEPTRFTIVGDTACGTIWEKQNAYQMHALKTDCTVILGDIVYESGRQSEYLRHFFPIYNRSQAGADLGAPLLRSVPFLAVPGNHDVRPPGSYSDGYAYFLFWSQPLNGPQSGLPVFRPASHRPAFEKAAGERYPRMASFSLDVGDVHWTMLDSNPQVDWTRPELRQWLVDDLKRAREAKWRFVAFHHSPFSSGEHHFREQHMRMLSEVFEQGRVDIVWSGHMHNYQRTRPLRFGQPRPRGDGTVGGALTVDKTFDGKRNTRPQGVLYVISGGGGAYLHDSHGQPSLQSYTARMVSQSHSFSLCEVTSNRILLRQITSLGQEVDRIVLER